VKITWFPANATSVLNPWIYRCYLHIQIALHTISDPIFDFKLARFVSVVDVVNSNRLAVKKTKAETVEKCFSKAGFGESDVADNLEESSEKIAAISNLYRGKELSCDTKNFVLSDDHLATHYSFESSTSLLAVRNTQYEDLEDDEEEQEGGEAQQEHRRLHRKLIHMNRSIN
jgi:hypothetical protein